VLQLSFSQLLAQYCISEESAFSIAENNSLHLFIFYTLIASLPTSDLSTVHCTSVLEVEEKIQTTIKELRNTT